MRKRITEENGLDTKQVAKIMKMVFNEKSRTDTFHKELPISEVSCARSIRRKFKVSGNNNQINIFLASETQTCMQVSRAAEVKMKLTSTAGDTAAAIFDGYGVSRTVVCSTSSENPATLLLPVS